MTDVFRFLIPGINNDDGWVMVEDEFYAVAQTYTQHLHYAEYLRRRREVKNENSASLEKAERHTDGLTPLPKDIQRKREQEALREQQKAGVAKVVGGKADEVDGEDDELFAGTHLHNLMTSPRKARSLAGLQALRTSTRASSGLRQQPASGITRSRIKRVGSLTPVNKGLENEPIEIDEETASDSDDDLGQEVTAAIPQPRKKAQAVAHSEETPRGHSGSELRTLSTSRLKYRAEPPRRQPRPASTFKSKIQSLFDDLDELPESSQIDNSISNCNSKVPSTDQQLEAEQTNNLTPKRCERSEVPTFWA